MSNSYEAPTDVRELEKMINNFTYNNGFDVSQVFNDFLTYIIHYFTPNAKPLESWKYNKEQTSVFWNMLCEWIKVMEKQLIHNEWYDPFGDLYMSCVASKMRQQGTGQFFTPTGICDMMAEMNDNNEKITGKYINDPACGSGRTLLAWHVRNIGNYLCAEDIDRTCCLMTVCNFIIHGCVGEVICHDSLDPGSFYAGWKINERLNKSPFSPIPLITVREITKEESITLRIWENIRLENEENSKASASKPVQDENLPKKVKTITLNPANDTKNKNNVSNKPIQLSLFD